MSFIKLECLLSVIIFTAFINPSSTQFRGSSRRTESSCEKLNSAGKEYLLDQESQRCYLVGSRGPCGELMTFYRNPSRRFSKYGFCDCDQGNVDNDAPCKDSPIRRRVYIHADRRCYTVFSQAHCKSGQWLVLDESESRGVCVPNPCLSRGKSRDTDDQFWFYDPLRRQCYKSFSQGYCPQGQQLELVHDSQYPECRTPKCSSSLAYGIRSVVSCQSGSRFSYLTRSCSKSLYTNFLGFGRIG